MSGIIDRRAVGREADRNLSGAVAYETVKRVLDIMLAIVGIVLFSPLWLAVGIAIRVASPGPALYIADTVGRHGKVFRLYKFRTMHANSDEVAHKGYLARFLDGDNPFAVIREKDGTEKKVYKIVNDNRVFPVGRVLRATGLDEAPQLLNVLKGEMSVVGPRPPRPAEFEKYEDWHKVRLAVMPGITGLYQVTARSVVPFEEMVRIDLEYVRRRSLWLDLRIMCRTASVMALRKGGY